MTHKKVFLPVSELKEGMLSARDVILNNNTLLGRDIVITEAAIAKLKQNFVVDKVEVYLDNGEEEPLSFIMKSSEGFEASLREFSSNLEGIFDSMSDLRITEMEEIRLFSKRIREVFTSTGLVIKNILLHGSGDDPIYRHSVNVAAISFVLGKWLGLNEKALNFLVYSAILHDIGKMKIDKKLLCKTGPLTTEEKKLLRNHPITGYNCVKEIPYLDASVSYGVLMHHERLDGSGYPLGIKGGKIHKFAKIIAIADVFDEACSNRYKEKINSPLEALEIIHRESFDKLDRLYCKMLLNHTANYYMGENVLLNNSHSCKIVKINMNNITRPLLLNDNGLLDLAMENDLYVEKLII